MTAGVGPAALVVGGTGTIGRAVTTALASRGWEVAVHCHAALPVARELAAATGGRSLAVTADLREEAAVRALVHRVSDHFGRLDAVVHCARRRVAMPFGDATAADLRMHFDANVGGPFVVAQEAAAVMVGQEAGGVIVFVVDPPTPGRPGDLPHAVSRSALRGLALAIEAECGGLAGRVRVVCVEAVADPAAVAAAVVAGISRATPGCGA
mgnify:CR=1 FL=1